MLLEVKKLNKDYQRGERRFSALKNVSFSMEDGEFICITGRSGSGKSTLINIIAGLLNSSSGEVFYNGKKISDFSEKEMADLRNTDIGFVPQGGTLIASLNILDNVRLPHYMQKREGDGVHRAKQLMNDLGIWDLKYMYPSNLSGGEIRRVAIARGLMNSPKLFIADEPTSDLDYENTEIIMKLFKKVAEEEGTGMLIVTHELDVTHISDTVYNMDQGKLEVV